LFGASRLWDLATGKDVFTFKGHNGWVWGVAFSKDGSGLVTGSQDTTARIWAVPPGAAAR
jgi:WD40 repeat protein